MNLICILTAVWAGRIATVKREDSASVCTHPGEGLRSSSYTVVFPSDRAIGAVWEVGAVGWVGCKRGIADA